MPAIYLVRHGQASFGSENYDVLSPTGQLQASIVGKARSKEKAIARITALRAK
jgi:broad specificity phosphatase PhoE